MALPKLFQRIFWHNNTTPAINEDNLNAMSKGLSDVDDRLIDLAGTIMEDVPQIQEDIEELEEDFALIDEKIADATSEANRATTKANEAAASVISAGNKALISEGYAKGTQNGTPVGSSSPYYHNNAEYFKEQARSFTPTGYQDLVDDVAEAQEAITDIEGEKVSSNDAYVLRQCKGNMVDLDLVGGSVAWNQLIQNGNFADTSGWSVGSNTTFTVSNNIGKVVPIDSSNRDQRFIRQTKTIPVNHKVLVMLELSGNGKCSIGFYSSSWQGVASVTFNLTNNKATYSKILNLINDSATTGLYFSDSTEVNISNFMCIDLTQLFGSTTIADYIYSLEQATAGTGIAWFRQYFPNAYYAYNVGEIKSVNPSSRKVVGKNIVMGVEGGTWAASTQTKAASNTRARVDSVLDVFPSTQYTISAKGLDNKTIQVLAVFYNNKGSGTLISEGSWNTVPYTFTTPNDCKCLTVILKTSNDDNAPQNYIAEPQIEIGTTATSYEPYQEYSYDFDTSKQLRGIFKLDANNKLYADGDIYTADGSITRKYGIVDLGTLNWTYQSDVQRFYSTDLQNVIIAASNSLKANIITSKYLTVDANSCNSSNDKTCAVSASKNILICDLSYSDATLFKSALDGVYLVYELATPTTESANAYQNPQRAFIDGTEEFVDAGVTASTRDVSIPVGNKSEYNSSVVLPISQDYTDGAMEILKEIVASSSDFADFKTKVAAL